MLLQRCPWFPWLLGGCGTLAFASQTIASVSVLEFNATRIIDGCYYQDRQYHIEEGKGHVRMFTDVDLPACQQRCQREPDCQYFSFFREIHVCWLAGEGAVFTAKGGHGGVAGPKFCPGVPSGCTERPGVGFPGATVTESELSFPSHRVPEKLECWPRNITGGLYGSCHESVVLEDTSRGWPGMCSGLQEVVVPSGETCESYCRKEVSCSVYQVVNDSSNTCFHSRLTGGSDCYMSVLRKPAHILEAKRIMPVCAFSPTPLALKSWACSVPSMKITFSMSQGMQCPHAGTTATQTLAASGGSTHGHMDASLRSQKNRSSGP